MRLRPVSISSDELSQPWIAGAIHLKLHTAGGRDDWRGQTLVLSNDLPHHAVQAKARHAKLPIEHPPDGACTQLARPVALIGRYVRSYVIRPRTTHLLLEVKMGTSKVRVAVNGYGAVGKCITDAIAAQEDMELVGVADGGCTAHTKAAVVKGYPVFAFSHPMSGVPIAGLFLDLLRQADVVADITSHPYIADSSILDDYRAAGVKVVFQSDCHYSLVEHSFVAQANYDKALGQDRTRVISSASTAVVRTLGALKNAGLLKKARGTLIGHAAAAALCTPSWERDTPATAFSPEGWEAEQILRDADVVTTSLGATHSVRQLHTWNVELTCPTVMEEILNIFRRTPRVTLLSATDRAGGLNRPRQPCERMWDVSLWVDSMAISGRDLFYTYEVYNPAAIVAETVDAIRALAGSEKDATASIARTDRALGRVHEFVPHSGWDI